MTTPLTPVRWAQTATLSLTERDCVTAVVLKVLDAKCKMDAPQQEAILAIYDTLERATDGFFDDQVHAGIEQARETLTLEESLKAVIHRERLEAEEKIEKPVMKAFKARLCQELFEAGH
jgi:hypothetical protein